MDNKRDFKVAARKERRNDRFEKARPNRPNNKKINKPAKRPMVNARRPAPRPEPMPRPRPIPHHHHNHHHHHHNHCCDNDIAEAVATIVGIATLATLIAD